MGQRLFYSALWLLLSTSVYSDSVKGKVLYQEAKCTQCHSNDIFVHEDRKIKNLTKLKKRVTWCAHQHGAHWFDDEVLDVVDYLNKHFYKFPAKE